MLSKKPRDKKHKVTDDRVKVTNEIIDSIRLLKMYAWETNFRDTVTKLRNTEEKYLMIILSYDFLNRAISFSGPAISSFLIFTLYSKTGGQISLAKVFPCFYVMSYLKIFGSFFVSLGLMIKLEYALFFKRVTDLMNIPEVHMSKIKETPLDAQNSIEFDNYTAFWNDKAISTDDDSSSNAKSPELDVETSTAK